jgi:hypothetical protein
LNRYFIKSLTNSLYICDLHNFKIKVYIISTKDLALVSEKFIYSIAILIGIYKDESGQNFMERWYFINVGIISEGWILKIISLIIY